MEHLVGDTYGLVHLVSSLIALVTGSLVLVMEKGTGSHKRIGFIYVISMVALLLTSLMIYRLFNGWGAFHYATIFSLMTLSLGMIPIWIKKPAQRWQYMHFSFMYWSVIGLYAAFAAEVLTRIPGASFFGMVGFSFVMLMFAGGLFFVANRSKWSRLFGAGNKKGKA